MHQLMFGAICVWLALAGSISSAVLYFLVQRGHENLRGWARLSYVLVAQGIIWAAAHLMFLVLHHRYEVSYVTEYSSNDLPWFYLISSFWGGQQGTFFLWAIDGAVLGVVFMTRCRRVFEAPAMIVVSIMQAFLSLLLACASPFVLADPAHIPSDGQGLNVLLQNHWMVIHPPIMFLGFSSLVFPFALGVAALVRKDYDGWITAAWPWILFSWCALGTGLFLGGYWAYTVLGWGGFWGWDNVENSSLIPWLATTALIHGLMLQRSRGCMKRANLLFALTPFVLVLFGSFLTRSGILADFSVHSFAAPAQTIYDILLVFVSVFFVGAIAVLLWRVRSIPRADAFETEASRGFFIIIGAWMIYACSLLVLYGTTYPLISRLWGKPANVSQPFYNHWLFPVAILLCVMMGITPFLKWKGQPTENTFRTLGGCTLGALVLGLALTVGNGLFFQESLKAPVDALVRSNPSQYAAPASPKPSGVLLNGRTSAQGAVTSGSNQTVSAANGETFEVPEAPATLPEAWGAALKMRNGYAYPIFAFAALFCLLANGVMVFRITGWTRRSWLPAGGFVTHIGVALLFIGMISTVNYGGDAALNLDPGQQQPPDPDHPNTVLYTGGKPVSAFGHSFTFQGYDKVPETGTQIMRIAVQTGDETEIGKPRLTTAKDGNTVHFPSIFKYWTEDLYLSPVKLPGQQLDPNMEFRFHVQVQVTHDGRTSTVSPGMAFSMAGGMHATDTPPIPGSDYKIVMKFLQTPTKDTPDQPVMMDMVVQRVGSFQKDAEDNTIHLAAGTDADFQGYHFHFVKFAVDQDTQEQVRESQKEANIVQVEVSTKPLINLVWLGTFFIIGGGLLALRRRSLMAGRSEVTTTTEVHS